MDRKSLMKLAMLALAAIALYYVMSVYSNKQAHESFTNHGHGDEEFTGHESFTNHGDGDEEFTGHESFTNHGDGDEEFTGHESFENYQVNPSEQSAQAVYSSVSQGDGDGDGSNNNQYPKDCFPKDQLTPGELLPGDANSKWAQSVPAGQGELGDQNFLTAGYHVGVNTVGQTLRNANRQLRSEPPNPQMKVSPWLQTTIDPDVNRRPMEIGGCE